MEKESKQVLRLVCDWWPGKKCLKSLRSKPTMLGYEEPWELPKGSAKTIEVRSGKIMAKCSKQRTFWAQRIRGRREV